MSLKKKETEAFTDFELHEEHCVSIAEHEVLLGFTNDDDALAFREWLDEEGMIKFQEWLNEQAAIDAAHDIDEP